MNSTCTKICFYDAHCLAGEFCEKDDTSEGLTGSNGVCLAGKLINDYLIIAAATIYSKFFNFYFQVAVVTQIVHLVKFVK